MTYNNQTKMTVREGDVGDVGEYIQIQTKKVFVVRMSHVRYCLDCSQIY